MTISETTIKQMVTKYSEQRVFRPLQEMRHWFTYETGAYIEPGYPPLFYSGGTGSKARSPNKSAVAAIGEAVAGLLMQRLFRCTKLARPNHDFPDIVMEDSESTFLVEAKATTLAKDRIHREVDKVISHMARLVVSASMLDLRPSLGIIVGTFIRSETDYYVCLTELVL